jgi:hypothetical protein
VGAAEADLDELFWLRGSSTWETENLVRTDAEQLAEKRKRLKIRLGSPREPVGDRGFAISQAPAYLILRYTL